MSGGTSSAEPANQPEHPALAPLLEAWQCPDPDRRAALLSRITVPGPIALRARYRHLGDPDAPPEPWDPDLPPEQWRHIIDLESDGDQALRVSDLPEARRVFTALLALEPSAAHRVVTVHARIGLGDVARAEGGIETAAGEYEAAISLAAADGYRFGELRALTGLGYLVLNFHSASTALDLFTRGVLLAEALGDPVYAGNCALGSAECEQRLGSLDRAAVQAERAYHAFHAMESVLGAGNAAQRLGAMLHRQGRAEEALSWYETAYEAFQRADNPVGLVNVLGGIGDVMLDSRRDHDAAETYYRSSLLIAERTGVADGRAHALQDLARVARSRQDWAAAAPAFERALAAYRDFDDILGVINALGKASEAYEHLGDVANALRTRLEAVFSIEEFRATHSDDRSQQEYRQRFGAVYAEALGMAVRADAPGALAVVADCLAGRRLAGLFAESARPGGRGELSLLQEMQVRADQRLLDTRRSGSSAPGGPDADPAERRERIVRLLGAVGVKYGLVEKADAALDDLLATVYLPPADEGEALLAALPATCHSLQLTLDPVDPAVVHWLWRPASSGDLDLDQDPASALTTLVGSTTLPAEAGPLVALLQADGDERAALRIPDLAPLAGLIPESLRTALAANPGSKLIIIPVGELWLVPWSAIPVGPNRVLGELAAYTLCPSLVIQRQLRGRPAPARGPRIETWRSPLIRRHGLERLRADPDWDVVELTSPAAAKERMRAAGDADTAFAVAGHGRPAPGLGHYLELAAGEWLLPVDLVGAAAPRRLYLVACWGGAVPGRGPSDPLSLATLALAAGSAEVLATVGELADTEDASWYVEEVLLGQTTSSLPAALCAATREFLTDDGLRGERIHEWAPLVPIGTFYED